MHGSRYTEPKDKEDGEPPGKPTSAQASLSSPPVLPHLTSSFGLSLLLSAPGHVVQLRSLPFGTKSGDSNHLCVCPCGARGIVMLETSTRNRRVPIPTPDQQRHIRRQKERVCSPWFIIDKSRAVPWSSVIKIRKDIPTSIILPSQMLFLVISALERFRPPSIEERILVVSGGSRTSVQKLRAWPGLASILVVIRGSGVVSGSLRLSGTPRVIVVQDVSGPPAAVI